MTRLSELYLDGTAVEELPLSFENLSGLTLLSLQDCKNLSSFPSIKLSSLKTLILSGCKVSPPKSGLLCGLLLSNCFLPTQEPINLFFPKLSRFSSLTSLDLSDCNLFDGALPDDLSYLSSLQSLYLSKNNFTRLPDSFSQLLNLKTLWLNNCSRLESLQNLPLGLLEVRAVGCASLETYSNQCAWWTSGETGLTVVDCRRDVHQFRRGWTLKSDVNPFLKRHLEVCLSHTLSH